MLVVELVETNGESLSVSSSGISVVTTGGAEANVASNQPSDLSAVRALVPTVPPAHEIL